MSQENVEVVRDYFRAWNAGDMEAVRELYYPDAVMEAMPDWPEPGPFVGRDAVMQELNHVRAAFDRDSVEFLSDLVAVGDRVIARTGWHGFGRGPQSDMEWTTVSTIRDGRILKVQYFWDHAEALEAAGLREKAMSQENVEVVRDHIQAFTHDASRALSFLDPFVVADISRVGAYLGTRPAYGREAVEREVTRYVGAFEEYAYEAERLTDLGGGAILAAVTETGRGKGSGAPVRHSFAMLYTVIDGKIARITGFPSEKEAIEAVGLPE
jgi:ketosteroid isomerase-like protein